MSRNPKHGLGGFRQGPVFLFARGDGFRFFGRLIRPGENGVTLELTRTSEQPLREMRMLPDAVPREESRAMARQLMEPYWEAAVKQKNQLAQNRALQSLAGADPMGVLQKLDAPEFAHARVKSVIQRRVAEMLAWTDPTEAETVAEAIDEPGARAAALVAVADVLPDQKRDQKLAVLDRAAIQARAAADLQDRLHRLGVVAERYFELRKVETAKTLFAEGVRLASQLTDKTDSRRGRFAACLARVDLPAALAIASEFPASGRDSKSSVLSNIVTHIAADQPAEAERILRQLVPQGRGLSWLSPPIVWKMAKVDPARARKLVDESQTQLDRPQLNLFLALGLKSRDPAAAHEAFQTAMRGIDRLMKEGPEYSAMQGRRWVVFPLVEQIDPALVPELFWRALATRLPTGNPRAVHDVSPAALVGLLGWYDREVAAALFEPIRERIEHTDDVELARWWIEFEGWSTIDPRAAVTRLEQVPVTAALENTADLARSGVALLLGMTREQRVRQVWRGTWMGDLIDRDEF